MKFASASAWEVSTLVTLNSPARPSWNTGGRSVIGKPTILATRQDSRVDEGKEPHLYHLEARELDMHPWVEVYDVGIDRESDGCIRRTFLAPPEPSPRQWYSGDRVDSDQLAALNKQAGDTHGFGEQRGRYVTRVWCDCGWEAFVREKNALAMEGK